MITYIFNNEIITRKISHTHAWFQQFIYICPILSWIVCEINIHSVVFIKLILFSARYTFIMNHDIKHYQVNNVFWLIITEQRLFMRRFILETRQSHHDWVVKGFVHGLGEPFVYNKSSWHILVLQDNVTRQHRRRYLKLFSVRKFESVPKCLQQI